MTHADAETMPPRHPAAVDAEVVGRRLPAPQPQPQPQPEPARPPLVPWTLPARWPWAPPPRHG